MPPVTRVPEMAEPDDFWPGLLEVLVAPGSTIEQVLEGTATTKVARIFPGARTLADGGASDEDELTRWFHITVEQGDEERNLAQLRSRAEVLEAGRVAIARPAQVTANDVRVADQWHLPPIRTFQAWGHTLGAGTTIAVLDTQVGLHEDLQRKLLPVVRVTDGCAPTVAKAPHGMWVAGTAAAMTNNVLGVAAPGHEVMVLPVQLGVVSGGECRISAAWPEQLRLLADADVRVANLSFGTYSIIGAERAAVRYAANRGMALVGITHNDNTSSRNYPGAYWEVMAIGATDFDVRDTRAQFSNYGDWIDMSAPGERILTTCPATSVPSSLLELEVISTYCLVNGTSFAAPLVSAGAALVLSLRPGEPGQRMRHRLLDAARDIGVAGDDIDTGSGMLDLEAALTDRVVRLRSSTRYRTSAVTSRESRPAPGGVADDTVVRSVVVTDGSASTSWQYAAPAAGLLGFGGGTLLLNPPTSLDADIDSEIRRLLGTNTLIDGSETNESKEVIVPGTTLNATVRTLLNGRYTVTTIGGSDIFRTARLLADRVVGQTPSTEVLVTSSDAFYDAVIAAGVAAGRNLPLLYVTATTVPAETCNWLRAHPEVTTIHVIGGPTRIPQARIDTMVDNCGVAAGTRLAQRHSGVDRYATSVVAAQAFFPTATRASFVNGGDWPDAISAASLASSDGAPVILTPGPGSLPAIVRDYAATLASNDAWIVGGIGSVTRAIENTLENAIQGSTP